MPWLERWSCCPISRKIADRHYNRQKIGSERFAPPGMCICLLSECERALFVMSWPNYASHAWKGAWINSTFRNEGAGQSSQLILEALEFVAEQWPFPEQGCVTFVDPRHVKPTKVRGKEIYGFCYMKAGFKHVGFTQKRKLWVWQKEHL
jgi:hypothetical protein